MVKHIILWSSVVLFVANLLCYAVLSGYGGYNAALSSGVIVITGILLYLTDTICLKDGFKASLLPLFAVGGIIKFALSLLAPNRFEDNWWLLVVIGMMAMEAVLLIVMNTVSNRVK